MPYLATVSAEKSSSSISSTMVLLVEEEEEEDELLPSSTSSSSGGRVLPSSAGFLCYCFSLELPLTHRTCSSSVFLTNVERDTQPPHWYPSLIVAITYALVKNL
jgi:hypothetical protein